MNDGSETASESDNLMAVSARVAERFATQGNWPAAAKIYCELADENPTVSTLLWNAAVALEKAGYEADAIAYLKKLLAVDATSADGWLRLGLAQFRAGAVNEAAESFVRVTELQSDNVEAQAVLARLMRVLDKHADATAHMEKAYSLNPAFPGVAADLAELYNQRGRFAESAQIAQRGLTRGPDPGLSQTLAHSDMVRMNPRSVLACGTTLMDCADNDFNARGTLFAGLALMLLPEGEQTAARNALRRHDVFGVSPTGALYDAIVGGDEAAIGRAYNQWNHRFGQFSSTASMFYLKRLLAREGEPVMRQAPRPVNETVSMRSLTSYGRLGHTLGNYLNGYFYCRRMGLAFETPEWQGHYIFELDEPLYRQDEPWREISDTRVLTQFAATGAEPAESYAGADIFSPHGETLTAARRAETHRRLQYRPLFHRLFAPQMAFLHERGATIVIVHLRYGDMTGQEATRGAISIESCNQTLRELWPSLDRPVLYVASDDPKKARESFASFAPLTLEDLPPIQPMLEHLLEFYVMGKAQVALLTRGSFGLMAVAVGTDVRQSYSADFKTGVMHASDIWRD